jgi:hypothetical protein
VSSSDGISASPLRTLYIHGFGSWQYSMISARGEMPQSEVDPSSWTETGVV